jgi:hypothetical protein
MLMHDIKWTSEEKKLSRRIFDLAFQRELADIIAEFKARAAQVQDSDALWAMQEFLDEKQRDLNAKYDYRYSQLIWVFSVLLRQKHIDESELVGLAEEKLMLIRSILSQLD